MQIISAEILTEANGLSVPVCMLGVILGVAVWSLGWHWHRFWIVLAMTIAAGLYGFSTHQAISPRMLAAGVLLAVAAGMMAVDMSRFLAFGTGGACAWFIVHKVLPAFQEPIISFLVGGILGILLYRVQLMILSSVIGALIAGHSLLLFLEGAGRVGFQAADWASNHGMGLNIAVLVAVIVGMIVQGQIYRWQDERDERQKERALSFLSPDERSMLSAMSRRWFWPSRPPG